MKRQIKYGFLIQGGEIYDTKIETYSLEKRIVNGNIIYYMKPIYYKRLYVFEPLLHCFEIKKVFELLNYNSFLRNDRERESKATKFHYMANMATIYNFPPKYMTNRTFTLYKLCQQLKSRL